MLKFISSAQSLWFTLNTSYNHGHHLACRYSVLTRKTMRLCRLSLCRPLVSRRLVVPAGYQIASHRPLVVLPSCPLITPACCHITSPCPLVAPRAALSSSCHPGWLLRRLSTRRPLVVLSSRRAASRCLVAPAGCCIIISCHSLVAPPSHPLIVLDGCCVDSPCTTL